MVHFSDDNIQDIFGIEDAEHERPERLKEFFFRNRAYDNLKSDLAIRILVGHKGVGKSALLRVAFLEDLEDDVLAIWLQPSALISFFKHDRDDLISLIEASKEALVGVIADAILAKFGTEKPVVGVSWGTTAAVFLSQVRTLFDEYIGKIYDQTSLKMIDNFRRKGKIRVYLDDLDRGWEAKHEHIRRISALLNAMRDICGSETSLQFRLGLRSDVYFLVRTSDESTDKIERHIVWLSWANHAILVLMAKRVETFFGRSVDEHQLIQRPQAEIAASLSSVIEDRFQGSGKWEKAPMYRVLLSLTRRRPRDLIKLFYGAARAAYRNNHNMIMTSDLRSTFESYSSERLQDIVNEFKTELPDISYLVHSMRPTTKEKRAGRGYFYTNDALSIRVRNILQQHRYHFTNGQTVTVQSICEFLYKIDFINARKEEDSGRIVRLFFDDSRYLASQYADYGFQWEVHPAYRWALQPGTVEEVFRSLDLQEGVTMQAEKGS